MAEHFKDKVLSVLFSGDDPKDDISNMLKQVAKDLQHNKFARFYKLKTEEIDASFLSFLFSVYRLVYPIKDFMKDEKKMGRLRQVIIEAFMDASILETVRRLDPAVLDAKVKTTSPAELVKLIQADYEKLVGQFDQSRINAADRCYSLVAALNQMVQFDFFGLFKKIDPHFVEASFAVEPKFAPIKLKLIAKELGEFLAVTQILKPEDDWSNLLNLLKICSGQELARTDVFIHMVKNLREIHTSQILLLMIQYTIKNPVWQFKARIPNEQIGEDWLEERKSEIEDYVGRINDAQKNTQIRGLVKEIFESTDMVRLENYTAQHGNFYAKRGLEPFWYAEGLNYLVAFIEDYLSKEIRELCDILLIRGQWTNNAMSKDMSESLHNLFEVPKAIAQIDAAMSEDGADGSRLRNSVLRVDRDKTQIRYINGIISKNNDEALEVINEAAHHFIVVGKHLKVLIEDVQKKHPELLINWRELHLYSKDPIPQRTIDCYKKINYFVQLMKLCTQ
ncbi:MAG: DUF5312 family protein [Spirochaetes bacterium]|nr:DUF5312 family protein [Spirochaetota bacterium]